MSFLEPSPRRRLPEHNQSGRRAPVPVIPRRDSRDSEKAPLVEVHAMSRAIPWRSAPSFAWLTMLVLALLPVPAARAQEAPRDGLFLTVHHPITSDVANRIKETTAGYLQRFRAGAQDRAAADRRAPCIVLDFNPDGLPSGTPDFGPCHDLARYLLELHDATTIAFVHSETTRHTVLPVLACKEIVLAEDASLGKVLPDNTDRLTRTERVAYEEVIDGRGRCPALVLKMLDPSVVVLKARKTSDGSTWYIDARRRGEEKGIVVTDEAPVVREGRQNTLYPAPLAREVGLCQPFFLETRQQVAEKYQLPPTSLREDPLMGRNPQPWRKEVRGAVNAAQEESLKRSVRRAIGQGHNLLILQLECGGGDTQVAQDLARWLRELKDDKGMPVMTVAYVPHRAPDTAAILALGCTEIVLQKNAEFGDFSALVYEKKGGRQIEVDPRRNAMRLKALEDLAQQQGYAPVLFRGMLDRQTSIYSVKSRTGPEWRLITQEEFDEDQMKPEEERRWTQERLVKRGGPDGTLLTLRATDEEKDDARKLGVARHVVGGLPELYALYGVNPAQVKVAGPDWLDELAAFLRSSAMSVFLVMLGITCLILELKLAGVGLPGVVAALCFVLFFWAHSQLAGQITMLAVLLFVLGLLLLGLEVFILPGFGVIGISGAVLLVVSLGLVTLEKKPETSQEWMSFGSTLATFGMSLVGAVIAALLLATYLPSIPYVNRLVLRSHPEETEVVSESAAEAVQPELAALLGAIGVAATPLRPAGKTQFGEEFVDVVAEGGYIQAGTRVQVVEIEGNRVVVKEV